MSRIFTNIPSLPPVHHRFVDIVAVTHPIRKDCLAFFLFLKCCKAFLQPFFFNYNHTLSLNFPSLRQTVVPNYQLVVRDNGVAYDLHQDRFYNSLLHIQRFVPATFYCTFCSHEPAFSWKIYDIRCTAPFAFLSPNHVRFEWSEIYRPVPTPKL